MPVKLKTVSGLMQVVGGQGSTGVGSGSGSFLVSFLQEASDNPRRANKNIFFIFNFRLDKRKFKKIFSICVWSYKG